MSIHHVDRRRQLQMRRSSVLWNFFEKDPVSTTLAANNSVIWTWKENHWRNSSKANFSEEASVQKLTLLRRLLSILSHKTTTKWQHLVVHQKMPHQSRSGLTRTGIGVIIVYSSVEIAWETQTVNMFILQLHYIKITPWCIVSDSTGICSYYLAVAVCMPLSRLYFYWLSVDANDGHLTAKAKKIQLHSCFQPLIDWKSTCTANGVSSIKVLLTARKWSKQYAEHHHHHVHFA